MNKIVIGTRGSDLALYQTRFVASELRAKGFDGEIEERIIQTSGDRYKDLKLTDFAKGHRPIVEKGVFTKELEDALMKGEIDAAVHSLKDLPSKLDPAFQIASVLRRAPIEDLLIFSGNACSLDNLEEGSCVATSSVRRARTIGWRRPDIIISEIRGNVPTRLRTLIKGKAGHATILARAGLERLGLYDPKSAQIIFDNNFLECFPLSVSDFIPAAGQGAIAVETLTDALIVDSLKLINDGDTEDCVTLEREFLRLLGAGCDTPVGVSAHLLPGNNELEVSAIVFDEEKLESDPKIGTMIGKRNELKKIAFDLLKQMGIDALKHE